MKNGIVGENKEGEGKEDDEQGEGTTKKAWYWEKRVQVPTDMSYLALSALYQTLTFKLKIWTASTSAKVTNILLS